MGGERGGDLGGREEGGKHRQREAEEEVGVAGVQVGRGAVDDQLGWFACGGREDRREEGSSEDVSGQGSRCQHKQGGVLVANE